MRKYLKKLSTFHFQLSTSRGFTLIELLAVMIVVITVGSIIGAMLFSALRGSNKTNTIISARQNGNYAITQMAKMIRYAKRFDGVSTDDVTYTVSCNVLTEYHYIKITAFDDTQTTFVCSSSATPPISSNSASLLDTDVVSVVPGSCRFSCTRDSNSEFPAIGIYFALKETLNTNNFAERMASGSAGIPFQTTVIMRNLAK